jgi:hypothetical protein
MHAICIVTDYRLEPRWAFSAENILKRIDANSAILLENKKLIKDFVVYLKARGLKPPTVPQKANCPKQKRKKRGKN